MFYNYVKNNGNFFQDKDFDYTISETQESNRQFIINNNQNTFFTSSSYTKSSPTSKDTLIDFSPSGPHFNVGDGHLRDCDAISDLKIHDPNNVCKTVYHDINNIHFEFEKEGDFWILPGLPIYIVGMPYQIERIHIFKNTGDISILWKSILLGQKEKEKYMDSYFITKDDRFVRKYLNGTCCTDDKKKDSYIKFNNEDSIQNGTTFLKEKDK
jgi:hypothetical protein